ncbi:MAG: bifunctional sulfate adenylyltransferase/adenylylsulfate kinase [Gammaproteobacteria bacterium]|nr:bifunctional sulfate adenylyltransferase/adenylylsulfate kinase [Gammaproteobacteria bacterium]
MSSDNKAHGGDLIDCYLSEKDSITKKQQAKDFASWDLTHRQICDIEMILNGAFSPLDGFMKQGDYQSVLDDMRLQNGVLWSMPITLDVSEDFAKQVQLNDEIALRDDEGVIIAVMQVEDIWQPNKTEEAKKAFGSDDLAHPAVNYLFNQAGDYYLGGKLQGLSEPSHYDFKVLRDTPKSLREKFQNMGWKKVVAFQTRNPMHRAHQELTFRAARQVEANLLIQPVVGMTKPGDIDHFSRVRCYEKIIPQYPEQTTMLSLLPLAMRMGGPREALWHAIIRKNYGCTHFIVGRDHAGPGQDSNGNDFYGPYDAQELMECYKEELGIEMVPFQMMVYVEEKAEYQPIDSVSKDQTVLNISGTEFRRRLAEGLEIPQWFSYPEVVEELRKRYPPRHKQGFSVFFTGLSGSGKSTIANALLNKLMEMDERRITLLDGDLVRKHLSSELGFSKEHRNLNILRIGYVASEITKNGGIAICAPIAPYRETRRQVRDLISPEGGFIEIHVATSLELCESRDRKGLYAKARAGIIKEFTGISDPYEAPENPELSIDTADCTPDEAAQRIILKLENLGYIR